jgi:hypothetical protein
MITKLYKIIFSYFFIQNFRVLQSLDDVSINYVTQPRSQGTVMAVTPGTVNADVGAKVKP